MSFFFFICKYGSVRFCLFLCFKAHFSEFLFLSNGLFCQRFPPLIYTELDFIVRKWQNQKKNFLISIPGFLYKLLPELSPNKTCWRTRTKIFSIPGNNTIQGNSNRTKTLFHHPKPFSGFLKDKQLDLALKNELVCATLTCRLQSLDLGPWVFLWKL